MVFELSPRPHGTWKEKVLHQFSGGSDGAVPAASLTFDQAGNLYGTTSGGAGGAYGNGTVFKLAPNPDGSWTESVLHSFYGTDGQNPTMAGLILDAAGNLYGTTGGGGAYRTGAGTVFNLTPNQDGSWTESVLHSFTGGKGGNFPNSGVIFDLAGNLCGTTELGGDLSCENNPVFPGCGTVFKLTLGSDGKWRERVFHSFMDHPGAEPWAGLVLDAAGNFYGTTEGDYGYTTHGSVFEITP